MRNPISNPFFGGLLLALIQLTNKISDENNEPWWVSVAILVAMLAGHAFLSFLLKKNENAWTTMGLHALSLGGSAGAFIFLLSRDSRGTLIYATVGFLAGLIWKWPKKAEKEFPSPTATD